MSYSDSVNAVFNNDPFLKELREKTKDIGTQGRQDINYVPGDPWITETFHVLEGPQGDVGPSGPIDYLAVSQSPTHTGGRKFDSGKLQFGLLPPLSLQDVVRVLTFGAQKYDIDNWKRVPDAKRRYFDAANRHIWAYKAGELNDPETGVNHLAHAICCLMFINDLDNTGD